MNSLAPSKKDPIFLFLKIFWTGLILSLPSIENTILVLAPFTLHSHLEPFHYQKFPKTLMV